MNFSETIIYAWSHPGSCTLRGVLGGAAGKFRSASRLCSWAILILLYINGLPGDIQSQVRLFADDTAVYFDVRNTSDTYILQADLDKQRGVGGWGVGGSNGLFLAMFPCREAGRGGFPGARGCFLRPLGAAPKILADLGVRRRRRGNGRPPAVLRGSLGRAMAHPSDASLRPHRRPPGACGGPTAPPPLARSRGWVMAHPSGAPLCPTRRPPRACGGPTAMPPSGVPPRQGYGTPLRRTSPTT